MNKRTKFLLGIGVIAALVLGWQIAAFAVHDEGVFELDGNATDQAVAGEDWDKVFAGTDTAIDTAFLEEEPADASSIFTGGGSKDPQDIPNWKWKNGGGLPDKDNLLHAFAATYTAPPGGPDAGDDLLYFGSDRFDNSGDAVQGFWFFQNEVSQNANGTFSGVHADGDLLVLSDFSNGGGTSIIAVYEWDNGSLSQLASSNSARCPAPTVTLTEDRFCGIVNAGTITLPWTFNDKTPGGTANSALNGEFYEGGVNLTELGLGDRCFSSVAAETRSSTSTTAVLKDFVLGGFGQCTAGLETTPVPANDISVGDTVHDNATLNITGTSTWSGTLQFFVCRPDELTNGVCAENADGSDTGTQVGADIPVNQDTPQPISSADVTVDEPGTWCFRGEFDSNTVGVPDSKDATAGECFTVNQPTGVITRQRWVPQDTATVTPAGTAGTVSFQLYSSLDCSTGTEVGVPFTDSTPDATTGEYETANTTITDDTTVSWKASFDPSGSEDPSTGVCESSNVTFDNDITTP